MKLFFISMLLISFLQSDEMQRIEAIVEDIVKLRGDYEKCKESLNTKGVKRGVKTYAIEYKNSQEEIKKYKKLLEKEKEKNSILKNRIKTLNNLSLKSTVVVKKQEKPSITKKEKIVTSVPSVISKKKNVISPAPVIIVEEKKVISSIPVDVIKEKEKIQTIKAGSFRLLTDCIVYDAPNGKRIDLWERGTSFTSNKKTQNWIKITGYFIDRKWLGAKKKMWVKYAQVKRK